MGLLGLPDRTSCVTEVLVSALTGNWPRGTGVVGKHAEHRTPCLSIGTREPAQLSRPRPRSAYGHQLAVELTTRLRCLRAS
jgi:hypothetical protein